MVVAEPKSMLQCATPGCILVSGEPTQSIMDIWLNCELCL